MKRRRSSLVTDASGGTAVSSVTHAYTTAVHISTTNASSDESHPTLTKIPRRADGGSDEFAVSRDEAAALLLHGVESDFDAAVRMLMEACVVRDDALPTREGSIVMISPAGLKLQHAFSALSALPVALETQLIEVIGHSRLEAQAHASMQSGRTLRLCIGNAHATPIFGFCRAGDMAMFLSDMRRGGDAATVCAADVFAQLIAASRASSSDSWVDAEQLQHATGVVVKNQAVAVSYDDVLRVLLTSSLLLRRTDAAAIQSHDGSFWLCAPRSSGLLDAILQGRKELIMRLKRRKYGESPRGEMERVRLTRSPLPALFHIRDAVGAGLLEQVDTAAGPVLRVK